MPFFSAELSAAIAARHGVVTTTDLLDQRHTRNTIRRAVTSGFLVRVHNGVFRVATAPATFESACAAACAADGSLVVTGAAAGRLWNFHHVWQPRQPIVATLHDRTPVTRGVLIRRTNHLPEGDVVQRHDGIRVMSPARSWFECARDVSDAKFEALTEFVIDRHSSVPAVWSTARRVAARGRPGSARVRRVLSQRAAWQKPAGSGLELRVLKALRKAGLPDLVRQHRLTLPNGIQIHCDGADPIRRWAIEIDHVTWHGGRNDAQRDKGRDRQLRRIHWQVERVTDQELSADFDGVIREVVELYELRCRSAAA